METSKEKEHVAVKTSVQNGEVLKETELQDLPHITIRGLPYDRGLSFGSQCKSAIFAALDYYRNSKGLPPWPECVQFARDMYKPAISKYYPRGLKEIQGIADGVGVDLLDIIILNARYDLGRIQRFRKIQESLANARAKLNLETKENTDKVRENDKKSDKVHFEAGECTAAVALESSTKSGQVLIGHNWDVSRTIADKDLAIILHVYPDPSENIAPMAILTEVGQLGRSGMNSDGLGIVGLGMWSTNDIFEWDRHRHPNGFLPITLLRRMFLESPTYSFGLRTVLQTPRQVSVCLMLATKEDESLCLELVPDHHFVIKVPLDQEFLTHSNHFIHEGFLARSDMGEGSRGSSSLFRDRRAAKYLKQDWPQIDSKTFQRAFKDHVGYPNSVCQHLVGKEKLWTSTFPTEVTGASIIYNLSEGTFQVCKGPPCSGSFFEYKV